MDISTIDTMIKDLEESEVTLSNIRNLSALYTVRNNLKVDKVEDKVTEELNDVLPSYMQYVTVKREYQMGETSKEKIASYLMQVCKEVEDFIHALYSGTDTPEERELIRHLITNIKRTF